MKSLKLLLLVVVAATAAEPGRIGECETTVPTSAPEPIAPSKDITFDELVVIGKKIWQVVKDGAPVVNYATDWAGAVPKNVPYTQMEHFTDYKWGPFGWSYKDLYGIRTVAFSWNFAYSCKGSYDGKGNFLVNLGPAIKEIYAAWGFTVNVNTTISDHPTNYGTKTDPIAGLQIEVTLDVHTVLQHYVNKCRVSVKGDCSAMILGCDGYNLA